MIQERLASCCCASTAGLAKTELRIRADDGSKVGGQAQFGRLHVCERGSLHVVASGDEVVRLRPLASTRIACESGSIWVTQQGEARDIFLFAGDVFVLDRPGLTLITATSPEAALRLQLPFVKARWTIAAQERKGWRHGIAALRRMFTAAARRLQPLRTRTGAGGTP